MKALGHLLMFGWIRGEGNRKKGERKESDIRSEKERKIPPSLDPVTAHGINPNFLAVNPPRASVVDATPGPNMLLPFYTH